MQPKFKRPLTFHPFRKKSHARKKKEKISPSLDITDLKTKLADRLPEFLDLALERYHAIISENSSSYDGKLNHSAKQETQAKSVLSHITLLIKLAEWVTPSIEKINPQDGIDDDEKPEDMVQTARRALAVFKNQKPHNNGEPF